MMKKILTLLASLGVSLGLISPALAQDSSFDREFSKFDKDFDRLNSWKTDTPASRKLKRAPATTTKPAAGDQPAQTEGATTPLPDTAESKPAGAKGDQPVVDDKEDAAPKTGQQTSTLPKGAKVEKLSRNDRLGNQISDPEMRKKVQALYRRQDVVVQQYVLPTN